MAKPEQTTGERLKMMIERMFGKPADRDYVVNAGTKARLVIVVEFDDIPEDEHVEEIKDKCTEQGGIEIMMLDYVTTSRRFL